jgi:cytochrome P450
MSLATLSRPAPDDAATEVLLGVAPPSPAGPVGPEVPLNPPPRVDLSPAISTARFLRRQLPHLFHSWRTTGDTFSMPILGRSPLVFVTHPDHARSLFTAPPELVPSITAESPLRPILGGSSVLTANGPRHMRQRRLLLPPFHGESIAAYEAAIARVVDEELDRWAVGDTFASSARMQAVTLGVIMAGIFGVEGEPAEGTPERALRDATRTVLAHTERPAWQLVEIMNTGSAEPRGILKLVMDRVDTHYLRVIRERRALPETERGGDVLSLLLSVTDEDGQALTDREIRDELMTLVLAGHETTANQLAWALERLVRTPHAYDALRDAVRGGTPEEARRWVDATIHETKRVRPVIMGTGRRVQSAWRLGEFVVPANTVVVAGAVLIHHREDLYPQPFAFRPERFLGVKPGTYTWLPFGGGTRRCLGAALAMAEQRIVLHRIAERLDLAAPDPRPEREQHRNVTMIPREGGRVTVRAVR